MNLRRLCKHHHWIKPCLNCRLARWKFASEPVDNHLFWLVWAMGERP